MKKQTLLAAAFAALGYSPAWADVHMDINAVIDLTKRTLSVSGTASKAVMIPASGFKRHTFKYSMKLPAPQFAKQWKGGAFSSLDEIYLPYGWYPATNEPITYNVTVESPVVTILPGAIRDEKTENGIYSARFVMEKPTESIPLFAGPYKINEIKNGVTRLRTYFYEDMETMADGYLKRTAKYIDRFEKQIGPFPFPEFHIIAAPIPAGYGFPGLTYMGKRVLRLPFIKESSLGHEILHNYWGNGVFPDYEKGNWSEGLTTYMADYMTAEAASKEKARDMRLSWLRDFNALPADQDKPIIEFVAKHGQASQVIGYHKVAFVFHMLRQKIGNEQFFKAIQSFWKDYAFKTASWDDLEKTFSAISKQDLKPFFDQWIKSTGAPKIESAAAKKENDQVNLHIKQRDPIFNVDLPVRIGKEDTHVTLSAQNTQAMLKAPSKATTVKIDPYFNIFRALAENEAPAILRDVMLADNVKLINLEDNDDFLSKALTLGERMVDKGVDEIKELPEKDPFIVVGGTLNVSAFLANHKLKNFPGPNLGSPTAYVWAGKTDQNIPYIIISVKNPESLDALLRPLPHYGKRGVMAFQGGKAIYKSTNKPLSQRVLIR